MTTTVRNPFRVKIMRDLFDGACKAYAIKHRDLFFNGERRRSLAVKGGGYGSSFGQAFWNGYDNVPLRAAGLDKSMIGYATYAAGRAIAAAESLESAA